MNQIEKLREDLIGRFPNHVMTIDAPENLRGHWFLDIQRGNASPIVVEWRPDQGFGISTAKVDDFGLGPDEIYTDAKSAYDRVVRLILSGGRTEPPEAVRLAELRQLRGLSQTELAERAGVGQANISRIESRDDILVSTLARIVKAMGATLSIRARFPDGVERELKVETVLGLTESPKLPLSSTS